MCQLDRTQSLKNVNLCYIQVRNYSIKELLWLFFQEHSHPVDNLVLSFLFFK